MASRHFPEFSGTGASGKDGRSPNPIDRGGDPRAWLGCMQSHPNDPLHGVTLEIVLRTLVERYGWAGLADHIPVRCFMFDPTIKSSLVFLRQTPWARQRLEDWYAHDARRRAGE